MNAPTPLASSARSPWPSRTAAKPKISWVASTGRWDAQSQIAVHRPMNIANTAVTVTLLAAHTDSGESKMSCRFSSTRLRNRPLSDAAMKNTA